MSGDQTTWQATLQDTLGAGRVLSGDAVAEDYHHDECLSLPATAPAVLVRPETTAEVAAVMRVANAERVPVTVRGSGTGLVGGCQAASDGILLSMERMNRVREIDRDNFVAVVEPGVTLSELAQQTEPHGLTYPIMPGEASASLGGNIATNAGGMRAVKYGVTRNNVLGLELVLATGEVIRTGGKFVKCSTGLDLTQLVIGSEGLLGVVTEATLKLQPFLKHKATLLVPFNELGEITRAVPKLLATGIGPLMLEYIDLMTMATITEHTKLDLGIPASIKESAQAYLVIVLEAVSASRLEEDVVAMGTEAQNLGAMDVFSLPSQAGRDLMEAREQAFWVAKKIGASEIIDVVVPRGAIDSYMQQVSAIAEAHSTLIGGCGHAGDGNVHLSIFQPDVEVRKQVLHAIFDAGMKAGGAISAEHGIGREKRDLFLSLEDPTKLELMRRIKQAFDPNGILNPGKVYG